MSGSQLIILCWLWFSAGTFKGDKKPHYWLATYGINDTSGAIYVMQQTRDYSRE